MQEKEDKWKRQKTSERRQEDEKQLKEIRRKTKREEEDNLKNRRGIKVERGEENK